MRRIACAVVCLVLSILVLSASAHALRYTVTDLNVPLGSSYDRIVVSDVNNSGQVVGWTIASGTYFEQGWAYKDGTTQVLSMVGYRCEPRGINDSGVIAGSCLTESSSWRPYLWQDGQMVPLQVPGSASFAEAWALNNNGQVAGYCQTNYSFYPCTWDSGGAHTFGTTPSRLNGLADNGTAVGQTLGGNPTRAFVVQNGTTALLPSLGGSDSAAYAVNETGMIAGYSATADGKAHACLWQDGVPHDLGVPVSKTSVALDVNESGAVVGYCGPALGTVAANAAFIWLDGVPYSLNDLIPADSGWGITIPRGINDEGQIVGTGAHNGKAAAFILTPEVPEPAGISALLMGMLAIGVFRRKRT